MTNTYADEKARKKEQIFKFIDAVGFEIKDKDQYTNWCLYIFYKDIPLFLDFSKPKSWYLRLNGLDIGFNPGRDIEALKKDIFKRLLTTENIEKYRQGVKDKENKKAIFERQKAEFLESLPKMLNKHLNYYKTKTYSSLYDLKAGERAGKNCKFDIEHDGSKIVVAVKVDGLTIDEAIKIMKEYTR